jgi:hypothetical protein
MKARILTGLATLAISATVGLGGGATSAFACSADSTSGNYHCYSEIVASGSATENYGMGATFDVSCVYLSSFDSQNGYSQFVSNEEWDDAYDTTNSWVEGGLIYLDGNDDIFSDAFDEGSQQLIYFDPSYNWETGTSYVDQIEAYVGDGTQYWLADIEGQTASEYDWSQGAYQTLGDGYQGGLELSAANYTAGDPGTYVGDWGADSATISSPFLYGSEGGGDQINTWRPTGSTYDWDVLTLDAGSWQLPWGPSDPIGASPWTFGVGDSDNGSCPDDGPVRLSSRLTREQRLEDARRVAFAAGSVATTDPPPLVSVNTTTVSAFDNEYVPSGSHPADPAVLSMPLTCDKYEGTFKAAIVPSNFTSTTTYSDELVCTNSNTGALVYVDLR